MSNHLITEDTIILEDARESRVIDFISLLKPRVMSLVVFSGFTGLYLAPGNINLFIGMIAIFCIALGSGAAGAINMWYDGDIDRIMTRTKNRAIPRGVIAPETALEFGVCMATLSVFIMAVAVNYLSAFLLLSAILFYVFIYTMWLKRKTPQNIVIGGAAGAFPPMIGWACVTNEITIQSLILFLIIFIWTPPHFWALALYKSEEYAKAGVPMLPVTNGVKHTKLQIVLYTIMLLFVTIVPYFIDMSSILYLIAAIIFGAYFLYSSIVLYYSSSIDTAPKLFGFSILYLFVLFTIMIMDKMVISYATT